MSQVKSAAVILSWWRLGRGCGQLRIALIWIGLYQIFVELRILCGLLLLKEAALSLVLIGREGLHHIFDVWNLDVPLGDGRGDNLANCSRLPLSW